MKKHILTLFSAVVLASPSVAQEIPNAGFEDWQSVIIELPDGWVTSNISAAEGATPNATKDTEGKTGNAIRLETVSYTNSTTKLLDTIDGHAYTGTVDINILTRQFNIKGKFPYASRPQSLKGFYKFAPVQNDMGAVKIVLTKWNEAENNSTIIGSGIFQPSSLVTEYTPFTAPIEYDSEELPDSAHVLLHSSDTEIPYPGTVLHIDELSLEEVTGVSTPLFANYSKAYPSPAREVLNFTNVPSIAEVIEVRDISGKIIEELKASEKINLSVLNYPAGMYHYSVKDNAGQILYSDKFTVVK